MANIVLTDAEIEAITRKKRPTAQASALRSMCIDFKTRPDGSLMVLRKALQADTANAKVPEEFQIDWDDV